MQKLKLIISLKGGNEMNEMLDKFSMDFFSLKGKVAIVTGGNTGLGQAYVVALAKAGADLFVVTYDTAWDETRELVEKEGRKIHFFQADLTDRAKVTACVEECVKVYGKIDILVNNAGTIRRAPLLEYKDSDWEAVININLNSVYYLSQDVAKIMAKQGGGKIINIASMLAFQGGKFVPPYTASKHGVAGITKAFANELAPLNIQTNAIAPGYIKTANTAPIRADEKRNAEILSRIPAERWADPFDLMGAVVFLASKASDYVNGHILAVDGGWLVR
jgi:2-deoxy-D-gluconate 3-dehydrogenase